MQVDDEQRIFARPGTVPQIHQSEAPNAASSA